MLMLRLHSHTGEKNIKSALELFRVPPHSSLLSLNLVYCLLLTGMQSQAPGIVIYFFKYICRSQNALSTLMALLL